MSSGSSTAITSAQIAFLSKLIIKRSKVEYQVAKRNAGILESVTILQLTKQQASRLIDALKNGDAAK